MCALSMDSPMNPSFGIGGSFLRPLVRTLGNPLKRPFEGAPYEARALGKPMKTKEKRPSPRLRKAIQFQNRYVL